MAVMRRTVSRRTSVRRITILSALKGEVADTNPRLSILDILLLWPAITLEVDTILLK